MKDPNERYWLFVAFTAWKTRQHLSATTFPPLSNIDFLHQLLSVCLWWYKSDKLEEVNFLFSLRFALTCAAQSLPDSESWGCAGFSLSMGHQGTSPHLVSWLLFTYIVGLRWVGGLSHQLIKMYELGHGVQGLWDELFYYFPLKSATQRSQLLPG